MKRILITLVATAVTLIAADAKEKTQTYEFGDITSIEAGWTYQVLVTTEHKSGYKLSAIRKTLA